MLEVTNLMKTDELFQLVPFQTGCGIDNHHNQLHVFYKKKFYKKMSLKSPKKPLKMLRKSPA